MDTEGGRFSVTWRKRRPVSSPLSPGHQAAAPGSPFTVLWHLPTQFLSPATRARCRASYLSKHHGQRLTRLHNDAPGDCRGRLLLLLILLLFYMSLKPHEQHVLSPSERSLSGGQAGSPPPPPPPAAAFHPHTPLLPLFLRLLLLLHTPSPPAWAPLLCPVLDGTHVLWRPG
ncbi:hypothetical protein E2C01_086355 [Portunus trituberculatus]|uniref:Uncharacterized protein n=1 Tax=Portunus trituberculatus TaxID=210409 RepID=A0A5B7JED4_PORTR|nr:hypothetical protein [Portunus trituberculatus]